MGSLDDTMPTTERPSLQQPERRRRSSLRVVVQEVRMLFGALSTTLQDLARNTVQLRKHAHRNNDNLTVVNLKLDLIMRKLGIEAPAVPSQPSVEIGVNEELNGAADER